EALVATGALVIERARDHDVEPGTRKLAARDLGGGLRRRVRRHGLQRGRFRRGQGFRPPIYLAGRWKEHAGARAFTLHGLENVHGSDNVHRPHSGRVVPRGSYRRFGGEVDDGVRPDILDGRDDRRGLEHVALERDERLAKPATEMPADKPPGTGD